MRFLMLNWRDTKNPLRGGAERVTQAHLAALVERGHEVYWYTFDFPGGAREETIDGIHYVRGGGKVSSIFKAIAWYRRQEKFDLVIPRGGETLIEYVLKNARVPVIVSGRGNNFAFVDAAADFEADFGELS